MGYFKLRAVLLLWVMFGALHNEIGYGQEVPEIDKLSEVNGDFQKINEVQQDKMGNLWIASDSHIEKYNSAKSEFFNHFNGLPEKTGKINTIFIDSKDHIWIGAEDGLFKYDPGKNQFEKIPSERPSTQSNIQRITQDERGTLWLGARNGIWNYSGKELRLITFFPSQQTVNQLTYSNDQLVFGTSKGLFNMDKNSNQYQKANIFGQKNVSIQSLLYTGDYFLIGTLEDGLYKAPADLTLAEKIYTLPYSSQKFPVTGLARDKSGNIYVATKGDGLLILDKNFNLASHYKQDDKNNLSLPDNDLSGLFLDEHNTLWISMGSGQINSINLKEKNFEFIRHDPKKYGSLADNFTTAIEEDTNGNIWFGTRQGLSIWNRSSDFWQHLKNLSFTHQSNIPDVIKDLHADGVHMWVATFNDGVYKVNINTFLRAHYSKDAKTKIGIQKAKSLLVDSNKNVWTGGEEGDLTQIKANGEIKTFPVPGVDAMLELSSGDIIAAGKNGVVRIRKGSYQISPIKKLNPNARNLPYFTINSLSETHTGEIILATEGAGIVIYYPSGDTYRTINKKSGMPSNRIQGLIIYKQDDIWAGTSNGLVNLNLEKDPVIRIFNKSDGLLSEVFTRGSYERLEEKLAFGTFKGVSLFNPEKLRVIPDPVPGIEIGSVNYFSKNTEVAQISSFEAGEELQFDHDKNSFTFAFYGIQPGRTTPLEYSWKLEGHDKQWSNPAAQTEVTYANLSPGNYKFLVKAGTSKGNWSPVKEIALNIKSPWWYSPGAVIGFGLLLILLLVTPFILSGYIRRKRMKEERSSLYKNLNQEIGTPLALILNSLDNLSEEEEVKNQRRLKKISVRLKELLEPVLSFRPSAAKLSYPRITKISIEAYMSNLVQDIQPLLKEKKLEIIVNDQWDKEFLYYDESYLNRIFFNIISNSVKYSFEGGKIIINLIQTNRGDLKVQVSDNGLGLPLEDQKILSDYYRNSKGSSVKGNAGHINLLYVKDFIDKAGGSVSFESSKNQGTTFTLILKNHQKAAGSPVAEEEVKAEEVAEVVKTTKPEIKKEDPVTTELIKILIVEDNYELRKVFTESFKKIGETFEAKDGMEAYEMATKILPDTVIVDFDMPGMNGLTLCKALKNNPTLTNTIFYLMISEKDRLQFPGMLEDLNIINKPVNMEVLFSVVSEKLNLSKSLPFTNPNLGERNSKLLKNGVKDNFILQLENHIKRNISNSSYSIDDLSREMGITTNTLFLKLKDLEGITPWDFILRTRLEFAKSLIAEGKSDLSEVSRQSGFPNKDSFFSAYKKHFGYMPGTIIEKK